MDPVSLIDRMIVDLVTLKTQIQGQVGNHPVIHQMPLDDQDRITNQLRSGIPVKTNPNLRTVTSASREDLQEQLNQLQGRQVPRDEIGGPGVEIVG